MARGRGRTGVVNVADVRPAPVRRREGWRRMDIRFLITDRTAQARTVCWWRTVFPPGAAHERHVHRRADEVFYVIRGRGAHGLGEREVAVGPGDACFIPRGMVHWLRNLDPRRPIELVGAYVGAPNLQATGYRFVGPIGDTGGVPRRGGGRRRSSGGRGA